MAEGGRTNDPLDETSTWPAVPPAPVDAPAPERPTPAAPEPAAPSPPATSPPPASPPPVAWPGGTPAGEPPRWSGAQRRRGDDRGGRIIGLALIALGVWLLLRRYIDIDSEFVIPIIAIAIGGLLLAIGMRPRGSNG